VVKPICLQSVTENGFAVKNENNMPLEEALADTDRTRYFQGHLRSLLAAVTEDGVDVKSYFAWSTSRLRCPLILSLT
jgi:beta-glucosidase